MKDFMLYYNEFGEGEPVVILHGLFGMSDNWKTFARMLSKDHHVITPDLRNHGRSPHDFEHNYSLMAEDVIALVRDQKWGKIHLIGHSMGGKVAMELALNTPNILSSLMVIDIAPVEYKGGHAEIIQAMWDAPLTTFDRRSSIAEYMGNRLKDPSLVQFLLKNIKRDKEGEGYRWRFNLESLTRNYEQILEEIKSENTFLAPTTFIKGEKSNYITEASEGRIFDLFPNAQIIEIKDAGHWVHADQPNELLRYTLNHLESNKQ